MSCARVRRMVLQGALQFRVREKGVWLLLCVGLVSLLRNLALSRKQSVHRINNTQVSSAATKGWIKSGTCRSTHGVVSLRLKHRGR